MLEDGDVVGGESGAILLYVLEQHGGGRLAPPVGSPLRASFLYWVFFAEATAFAPIVTLVWHARQAEVIRVVRSVAAGRSVSDSPSGGPE